MTWFAERFGYVKPPSDLRENEMPDSLVSGLWEVISELCLLPLDKFYAGRHDGYTVHFADFSRMFWSDVIKRPLDTRPRLGSEAYKTIREYFFNGKFFQRYDLLERSVIYGREQWNYTENANAVLERERSAFRFAGNLLVLISDPVELDEISIAMASDSAIPVRNHLRRAAELYSNRQLPDYRNSIKESISAVEAAVSFVTGEKNAGINRPLQRVLDDNVLHPALRLGFEKLYSYTSDADGIRHALLEDGREVMQEDARYMLISCSAFSNYLLALSVRKKM